MVVSLGDKNIKKVLVDFDGTLVDSFDCWMYAYGELCLSLGFSPNERIRALFPKLLYDDWAQIVCSEHGFPLDKLVDMMLPFARVKYLTKKPFDKVLDIIYSFPLDANITIVTKEPVSLVKDYLRHFSITRFNDIKTVFELRENVDFYRGVDVVFEDNLIHCKSAKRAGAFVVAVGRCHSPSQKKDFLPFCDAYIS